MEEDEVAELSTNCRRLKLLAKDGKIRETDCGNRETIFRIIQSVPSPNAEPFKLWFARLAEERIQEVIDPELAIDRARQTYLNKGYTEDGFADKVFHLHVRYTGDNDELYFRDYLMGHPDAASEYEKLKLKLWKKFEHNRDAYTNAKSEFVYKCTEKARLLYGDRYKLF